MKGIGSDTVGDGTLSQQVRGRLGLSEENAFGGRGEVRGLVCQLKGHSLGRVGQGQEGSLGLKASNSGLTLAGLVEEVGQNEERDPGS